MAGALAVLGFALVALAYACMVPRKQLRAADALLVFLLPHLARQCIATAFFLGGALGSPAFADIRAIGLPRMEGVLVSESREGEYVRTLQSGVALLREQGVRDETLMTLDFANPFPVLLDLPRPLVHARWAAHQLGNGFAGRAPVCGRCLHHGSHLLAGAGDAGFSAGGIWGVSGGGLWGGGGEWGLAAVAAGGWGGVGRRWVGDGWELS